MICKLFGHKWVMGVSVGWGVFICKRCGKQGDTFPESAHKGLTITGQHAPLSKENPGIITDAEGREYLLTKDVELFGPRE